METICTYSLDTQGPTTTDPCFDGRLNLSLGLLALVSWINKKSGRTGIDAFDAQSGELREILPFPYESGVFALARTRNGSHLAAGTQGGLIHVMDIKTVCCECSRSSADLLQGAPVLSLAFPDETTLAAADTAGRCLVWDLAAPFPTRPKELSTHGECVCALYPLSPREIIGLSCSGRIIHWRLPQAESVVTACGPPPSAPLAWVRWQYWEPAGRLVYPVSGGRLGFYDPHVRRLSVVRAHQGEVLAITATDDLLLSIGVEDASLLRWKAGTLGVEDTLPAPAGVVAAAILEPSRLDMLLLRRPGILERYDFNDAKTLASYRKPNRDSLTILGPDLTLIREIRTRQAEEAVLQLTDEIGFSIEHDPETPLDALYTRLINLGQIPVALRLQVQQALARHDLPAELGAWSKLIPMLSPEPQSIPGLLRYAEVCLNLCQYQEALATYRSVLSIEPDHPEANRQSQWLNTWLEAFDKHDAVVQTDQPFTALIEAARMLAKPFSGQWAIQALSPRCCPETRVEAQEALEACQSPTRDHSHGSRTAIRGCWLSAVGMEVYETLFFPPTRQSSAAELLLAARFHHADAHTVIVPVVVVQAERMDATSADTFEKDIRMWQQDAAAWSELLQMRNDLTLALRKLVTQSKRTRTRRSS